MIKNNQRGVVLISALLFLLVITVLVLAVIENNVMQIKMSSHYRESIQAFENAESLLSIATTTINAELSQGQSAVEGLGDYIFILTTSDCNNLYYLVTANGVSVNAKMQLQSSILLPKSVNCNGQSQTNVEKTLLYWMELKPIYQKE